MACAFKLPTRFQHHQQRARNCEPLISHQRQHSFDEHDTISPIVSRGVAMVITSDQPRLTTVSAIALALHQEHSSFTDDELLPWSFIAVPLIAQFTDEPTAQFTDEPTAKPVPSIHPSIPHSRSSHDEMSDEMSRLGGRSCDERARRCVVQ